MKPVLNAKVSVIQILAMLLLYTLVYHLFSLLFSYIDIMLHESDYISTDSIRLSMAWLIIGFPVYLWAEQKINKEIKYDNEIVNAWLYKWLIYLSLFFFGSVIIGSLIMVLYRFLEGELTLGFGLKVLCILCILGITFKYYLGLLARRWKTTYLRIFSYGISVLVFICVIAGFFTVGSPFYARLQKYDQTRTQHLQLIQSQILEYWRATKKLPIQLTDLNSDITGFQVPLDPKTRSAYDYRVIDNTSFELCADFMTTSKKDKKTRLLRSAYYNVDSNLWDHRKGRSCFVRKIDPKRDAKRY